MGSRSRPALLGRLLRRVRSRRAPAAPPHRPLVSVVVPVYNVEAYLEECLHSVLSQTWRELEVIVVDDGSTDRSPDILARVAARDPRVRVHRQPNGGLGNARNAGIALATGTYLTFLDSDDTVPRKAYEVMVRSLERSGSDFAVGALQRIDRGRRTVPRFVARVHARTRTGVTIEQFPAALQDVVACNRMLRTDFWSRLGLRFPEGVAYEDHAPMVRCYLEGRFDVLRATTYHWRIRDDRSSLSQQKHHEQNLRDRLTVLEQAYTAVSEHGNALVTRHWLRRVLDSDLSLFVDQLPWVDEQYWTLLRDAVGRYMALATPEVWQGVRVDRRVKMWLVGQGERAQVEQFLLAVRTGPDQLETEVRDGRPYAVVRDAGGIRLELPEWVRALSSEQTPLRAALDRVSAAGSGELVLGGWAYIDLLDLADEPPEIEMWLVEGASGARIDLPVRPQYASEAARRSRLIHADVTNAGFEAVVPVDKLLAASSADSGQVQRWRIECRVTARGVVRRGRVSQAVPGTTAACPPVLLTPAGDRVTLAPRSRSGGGMVLEVRRSVVQVEELMVDDEAVHGRLTLPPGSHIKAIQASRGKRKTRAELGTGSDHANFRVEVGRTPKDAGLWQLRTLRRGGRAVALPWPAGDRAPAGAAADGTYLVRLPNETAAVQVGGGGARVESLEVDGSRLRLAGAVPAAAGVSEVTVALRSHRQTVTAAAAVLADGTFRVDLPLQAPRWGEHPLPLPRARYTLTAAWDGGRAAPVTISPARFDRLPRSLRSSALLIRPRLTARGRLQLEIAAPLSDDERSRNGQERLRRWYRDAPIAPEPDAVLFQCYRGETATDSQLAIHQELRARGAALTLYWGVEDHAVAVPEGAVPVLIGSKEWYRVLAAAGFLCNNIDFDPWFQKRAHQRFLQTFHGYPFKTMGLSFWRNKNFIPSQLDAEVRRRCEAWDVIITPTPEMDRHYREQYRYEGPILATGYPRDDALVAPDADRQRRATRELLGIAPEQQVLLYAPTWRDSMRTGAWSAAFVDHLDVDVLAQQLGPAYVVLLRGHNYNARTRNRHASSGGVIDVTDYPEINDLVLASDLAVLDYSSLRFDYALTGRPMLFFVPDFEEYRDQSRGFLFDFEPTAPGPLLRTRQEVLAAVRDIARVSSEHAAAYTAFNERFNSRHDGHATVRVVDAFFGEALQRSSGSSTRSR